MDLTLQNYYGRSAFLGSRQSKKDGAGSTLYHLLLEDYGPY